MAAVDGLIAGPAGPWLAILGMAFATYLLRIGGGLIMSRIRITPAVERALDALPGSIVAATVVPIAIKAGPAAILGVVTAIVTARLTRSELAALVLSLVVAAGARALGL
ncbi:AzlD family protein [uncultured Enterovirga sp.]|uniref:AzlD family protein n=1 Tax=uncultured Enterovirga sp. TaxID=2026352 RepID=UPI0035CA3E4F